MSPIRLDERLAEAIKPSMVREPTIRLGDEDLLVACAGFEDRSIAWLQRIVDSGSRGFEVLVCNYLPAVEQNRSQEVADLIGRAGGSVISFNYSREDPAEAGTRIVDLASCRTGRVYVDVSGMSRLLIVQVVASAFESGIRIPTILYTEAEQYPPSLNEVSEALAQMTGDPGETAMFLSSGVFETVVVPELSAVAMLGQPIRLVAFPSFNTHQLLALRSEIQASFWTLINGVPPSSDNAWRREALRKLNRIDSIRLPIREERDASTLDYSDCLKVLLSVYQAHSATERILVAPTGSKMQAVAIGVFRGVLSDVQIVYPTPRDFINPKQFTLGARAGYALDLEPLKQQVISS